MRHIKQIINQFPASGCGGLGLRGPHAAKRLSSLCGPVHNKNKKLVFVYLVIGLFNAFMESFKADYFQKVIDALAERTLAPYSVVIYGSILFIGYLMNYADEYPAKKLEHGIFLDFKLMGLEKISRISYQEYQKLRT